MNCSRNDIVLLPIPFTDLTSKKVRPAVVIGKNSCGDLMLVPITSQLQNADFPLKDWAGSGLNVACGIKSQIATVEEHLAIRVVGKLSLPDQSLLDRQLRQWLQL